MTKMIDVARHAGVSIKTVSRVLNNEPHVQDGLREKVRESVRELGYVPSTSARSLRSNRSYRIHLVTHTLQSNFVYAIQFGAMQACQKLGYQLTVSMLDVATAKSNSLLRAWCEAIVGSDRPDGIILIPPMSNDPLISSVFSDLNIPIVRIGPNEINDNNATVMIDDRAAAEEATEHLIDLGHTRIAFIRGKEDQDATHQRYRGYCDALFGAGIEIDENLVRPGFFDFQTGLTAGADLLKLENPPTGIFAANDDMAAGVLAAAHRLNIQVPEALSIIGFDDSEIAEKMWPALTTIRQPLDELGAKATEVLVKVAGQNSPTSSLELASLPYSMIIRQSTGPCCAT